MQEEQKDWHNATPPDPAMQVKKIEKGDVIQAPPWCRFQVNEVIPLKGFNFRCIGYTNTPKFEPVFQCVGPTSKHEKEMTIEQLKHLQALIIAANAKPTPDPVAVD